MILGHRKNELALINVLASGKVFPTWIFNGRAGIGKSLVARRFANCLLSNYVPSNGILDVPINDPISREIKNCTHPDFAVLEQSDDSVSIDDIRKLFSKIYMAPIKSQRKVIILDNASKFNKNITNSLLKVLEEPPENTVIIMICSTMGNIPRTLLSRAMQLYFPPLSKDIVQEYLVNNGIENADELANLSGGSIGIALKLHENFGLKVYQYLRDGFEKREVYKAMKFIKANEISFDIVKLCLLHILHEYAQTLEQNCFKDQMKIEKILQIIFQINRSDAYALDKNAVIASTYERFFCLNT